ncbi:hypothetical protein SeMB42_g00279 [Synchytrium endobioticum]|uniref:6-phosphofructo-2-kinase domain-containing protein n=1 Tax=Synchytrium endobioticum TaxID=286115 RepID=A0A507DSI2_9FUNG|nr:hypothetical protein SeLEV6574_g00403 [Synchytrium endobioticum]TPX54421.1 hypothetical protein SeMB42_g00279 [Synchytrium endobioticum]
MDGIHHSINTPVRDEHSEQTFARRGYQKSVPISSKLCVAMVGLPARGKTYVARKIVRYLNWLGYPARIYNVGQYRREAVGAVQQDFWDHTNQEANTLRNNLSMRALKDMIQWLQTPTACVAIYDAANTTPEKRKFVLDACNEEGVQVMFVESICDDQTIIMENIKEVKISSPDYAGIDPEEAVKDFMQRIKQQESTYEKISTKEMDELSPTSVPFIQLVNIGTQVLLNRIRGYLPSRICYFCMNLNIAPRHIYMSRHGESDFNVAGKIGGNSNLSKRGEIYAQKLPRVIAANVEPHIKLSVWTSTLKRTMQTAAGLPYPKIQWRALDELDSGLCDGLTYEEIDEKYPLEAAERARDKFLYRYPGGESYRDLVQRLEPIIMELERPRDPDRQILIISHQAVIRALYAYFMDISPEELPYVNVPLHTVFRLTPKAYKCEEVTWKVDVPAVSTYRPRLETPTSSPIKAKTEALLASSAASLGDGTVALSVLEGKH